MRISATFKSTGCANGSKCPTAFPAPIIENKADYILALKGNQGNLHKEAQDQFHFAIRNLDLAHSEGWSHDQKIEKSNGRIVTRSVTVNHRLDWMDTEIRGKWRDLRSLIHVETQMTQLDSDEIHREVRYYISSLDEPASAFQSHIRQHWSIENSCHWVLDTAFREDHNQTYIGHAAKTSEPCAGSSSTSSKST